MSATVEKAYGYLWHDGSSVNAARARKLLRSLIDKEGQKRGIQYAKDNTPENEKAPMPVTGICLKNIGDYTIVEAEIFGRWVEVIRERSDGAFSHIVEPAGMTKAFFTSDRAYQLGKEWE